MDKVIDLSLVFRNKVDTPEPRDLGQQSSVERDFGKSRFTQCHCNW